MENEKWKELQFERIERLAIQYGFSFESAFQVALDVFRFAQDGSINSQHALYAKAIERITEMPFSIFSLDEVFQFQEDTDLHAEILKLDSPIRLSLLLSSFHEFTSEEMAILFGTSREEVEADITTARFSLQRRHLDKQLELLGKSYGRLPLKFKMGHIVKEPTNSKIEDKKPKFIGRFIAFGVLLIAAAAFIFIPVNKEQARSEPESEFKNEYQKARNRSQEILQLESNRFEKLEFIQEADREMAVLLEKETEGLSKELELEFEAVLKKLKLPSVMLDEISHSTTISLREEEGIEFLILFRKKSNELISIYNEILWDYREEVQNFNGGTYKAEQMMRYGNEFSEELQNMISSMKEQSIQLISNVKTGRIEATLYNSDKIQDKIHSFHPNLISYFFVLLMSGSLLDSDVSLDELFHNVLFLEDALKNVKKYPELYPEMEKTYASVFYKFVKGSSPNDIFDAHGMVYNSYQEIWQRFMGFYGVQASSYLMQPIVEEMEASGWKTSKSWDALTSEKIVEALELVHSGELEKMMYGERPVVESHVVELPDDAFFEKVEDLYTEFKKSYNIEVFKGLSPLYTVGVFDWANEMSDPTTMFHLLYDQMPGFSETGEAWSLESYVEHWKKGFSLFRNATRIEFTASSMERLRHDFYAMVNIELVNGGTGLTIFLDGEQNWFLGETVHTQLPSEQVEMVVQIDAGFEREIKDQYEWFSEIRAPYMLAGVSPNLIAGLYLYAGEQEDYETQYALIYKDVDQYKLSMEEFLEYAKTNPTIKMAEQFESLSFRGLEQDKDGNWPGVVELSIRSDKNLHGDLFENFRMMWREDMWYVQYKPME